MSEKSQGLQTELLVCSALLPEWKVKVLFSSVTEPDMVMAQGVSDKAVGGSVGSIESVSDRVEPKGRMIGCCHPEFESCLNAFALLSAWERDQSSTYISLTESCGLFDLCLILLLRGSGAAW